MQPRVGDDGPPSIAVRVRGNKGAKAAAGLLLAGCALLGGCGEPPSDEVLAPIGGASARGLPHGDVLGFVRLRPDSRSWIGLRDLCSSPAAASLGGSLFEPAVVLLRGLLDETLVGEKPVTVLFLEPKVHDSSFAVHVPAPRAQVLAALERVGCPRTSAGGIRVARRPSALANPFRTAVRLAGMALPVEEDAALVGPDAPFADLMWIDYSVVEDAEGVLLLPRREGLRNVRDTLELARSGPDRAAFLSLDLDRLLRGGRGEFRSALQAPLVALSISRRGSYDRGTNRRANRWLAGILDLVYDLAEGVDHAFVEEVRPAEWLVYLRTAEDGLTRQLLPAFGDEDPKVLLGNAPLGLAAAGLAYDVDALATFWEREGRGRFRRYRVDASLPASDPQTQGNRLWLGVTEPSGPYQLGIGGLGDSRPPLEQLDDFASWVDRSADGGLLSLVLRRQWSRISAAHGDGALLGWVPGGQAEASFLAGFLPDKRFLQYRGSDQQARTELDRLGRGRPGPWSRLGLLPDRCSGILQIGSIGLGARVVLEVDGVGLSLAISLALGG